MRESFYIPQPPEMVCGIKLGAVVKFVAPSQQALQVCPSAHSFLHFTNTEGLPGARHCSMSGGVNKEYSKLFASKKLSIQECKRIVLCCPDAGSFRGPLEGLGRGTSNPTGGQSDLCSFGDLNDVCSPRGPTTNGRSASWQRKQPVLRVGRDRKPKKPTDSGA